jgi:hypothetical protein
MRNWTLIDIFRGDARCDKCRAQLKWVFLLQQGDDVIVAGSECVKALTYRCDPHAALHALTGKWRARRSYYYKRIHSETWSIGLGTMSGRWWVGHSASVGSARTFIPGSFASFNEAKCAVARLASTGAWQ